MDEPSDEARAVIAGYRRARVLDPAARARVHARLLASTREAKPIEPTPTRMRQLVTIAAIAMATAAGVVLAAQLLWGRGVPLAEAPSRDAATYDVDARASADAVGPATPPTPVRMHEGYEAAQVEPPLQRSSVRSTTTPGAAATTTADADALAAEIAHMQAARAALARGDTDAALRELAAHERAGARAQLVEERKALRIEALCLAGKRAQARAEAKLFEQAYPRSTHRERVAAACD
ncbi:MAG: hypothetical protein IAG13_37110 [Deltaproteobacteria bacterium]|nr:hypothetical protein [Nannocystaceae bacterium]